MTLNRLVRWTHKECGYPVMFDMSGGFCFGCDAEGLTMDEIRPPEIVDDPARAWMERDAHRERGKS